MPDDIEGLRKQIRRAVEEVECPHVDYRNVYDDCSGCVADAVLAVVSPVMQRLIAERDATEIRRLAQATTETKPGINGAPVPDRIDYDDDDELDDVVVNNCDAHLERLDTGRWYLGLYGSDGRILQITIGSKTGRAVVTGVVTYDEGFEATTEETNDG